MSKFQKVLRWIVGLSLQLPVYFISFKFIESKGIGEVGQVLITAVILFIYSIGQGMSYSTNELCFAIILGQESRNEPQKLNQPLRSLWQSLLRSMIRLLGNRVK
jgi:hypothetical protein